MDGEINLEIEKLKREVIILNPTFEITSKKHKGNTEPTNTLEKYLK